MPRPKKDKELIIKIAGEIIKLREGETRTVHLPMTLKMVEGILFFMPPEIIAERGHKMIVEEMERALVNEDKPNGAPPPQGDQTGAEYEREQKERKTKKENIK